MRVVTYSRFSSDHQKESSLVDQERNCATYAARQCWTITKGYQDAGISGSTSERPGYQAMLTDAKAKLFDVVLVDDLSRLSRDSIETEQTRRRLLHWGIRLIGVSDGIDTASKGSKMLVSMKGMMNDVFLDDLGDKIHRGQSGQALSDYHTGGRLYGYRHVPLPHPTEKDAYGRPAIVAVRREIDPEQARVLREIGKRYAAGQPISTIVDDLNRRGVPGPSAHYHRVIPSKRAGTWSRCAMYRLLKNRTFIGESTWNKRQWVTDPETGSSEARMRPESEWIVRRRDDLRIFSDAIWDQIQARMTTDTKTSRPGRKGKYLLSGLLKCAVCGGNYTVQSYYQFGCATHHDQGKAVCTNRIRVARDLVGGTILTALQHDLFSDEVFAAVVKEATRALAEANRERTPAVSAQARSLAKVEGEIANLMTAIKAGILTPSTKHELERLEAERHRLTAPTIPVPDRVVTLLPRIKERYQKMVSRLASLPSTEAREQIRQLVGEITLTPMKDGRHLSAELTGHYQGLMELTGLTSLSKKR